MSPASSHLSCPFPIEKLSRVQGVSTRMPHQVATEDGEPEHNRIHHPPLYPSFAEGRNESPLLQEEES
jgi:hypothetical protein